MCESVFFFTGFFLIQSSFVHIMALPVEEIRQLVAALGKQPAEPALLEILELLSAQVDATESLLRETKVGVAVNKLRSHESQAVAALAKRTIKKWKEQVSAQKKAAASSKTGAATAPAAASTADAEASKPSTAKVAKAEYVSTKPRTAANDGVKTSVHSDSTRNGAISGLYTALASDSKLAPNTILKVSTQIEQAVFDLFSAVNDSYRNKTRSLVMNLRNKNNPDLRQSVLQGDIPPSKLVTMDNKELAPKELKKQMETLHQKNLFDAQGAVPKKATTDRFVCGKCKMREVSYYQMQTRSADEPLTTFCTCEKCGNRWKFC